MFVSRPVFLFFISVILVRFLREALSLFPSSRFQLSSSSFKGHNFLPPTCALFPFLFPPYNPHFCLFPSTVALPPTPIHAVPNLNPIFHITSRKSYSAVLGGAGSNATHGSRTKERRNIFIFSLLPSSLLFLPIFFFSSLVPSKVKQFWNILPEYGCDLSLLTPALFPPHRRARPSLCRPAYSTLVEDVITRIPLPLPIPIVFLVFVLCRPCTTVACISTRKKFPGGRKITKQFDKLEFC